MLNYPDHVPTPAARVLEPIIGAGLIVVFTLLLPLVLLAHFVKYLWNRAGAQ